MNFKIIVAYDSFCGIGKNGTLPWTHLKHDMERFRNLTVGKGNNAVVMGRKTWESLPSRHKPLKDRTNFVLSKTMTGENIVHSFEELQLEGFDEVWFIGGRSIYELALRHFDIESIYVTEIHHDFNCDAHFPFTLIKDSDYIKELGDEFEVEGLKYTFKEYHKNLTLTI
jgi:dihydrofolate reductase